MDKKTLYIELRREGPNGVLGHTIAHVATTLLGATVLDKLVGEDGTEVAYALTDSVRIALRMHSDTEATHIIIAYSRRDEEEAAKALAGRFPERMTTAAFIGREGEMSLMPQLMEIFTQKSEGTEVPDAGPTRG